MFNVTMETAYQYDDENKQLHPFPAMFAPMLCRDFDTGFSYGIYDAKELASHEFTVTNGKALRAKVALALVHCSPEFMAKRWHGDFTAQEYHDFVTL